MRLGILISALLMLSACDSADATKSGADNGAASGTEQGVAGGDYDYRLAFRVPPSRISPVQDAHVRACDQLGPSRCRVMTVRYHVGADNRVSALLALMIDPAIARNFGQEASKAVTAGGGALIDSRMAGSDTPGSASRAGNVVARLRDEVANIDTQLRRNLAPAQRAAAIDKQNRLRAAIQTIGEIDQGALQGAATSPILFTYISGSTLPALGGSPGASFNSAGDTFLSSLAGLTQVLAGVGPWLLVLIGGALILRRLIPAEDHASPAPLGVPLPHEASEERGIVHRIFSRDDHHDDTPHPGN